MKCVCVCVGGSRLASSNDWLDHDYMWACTLDRVAFIVGMCRTKEDLGGFKPVDHSAFTRINDLFFMYVIRKRWRR